MKYKKIMDAITEKIKSGEYKKGERIPSIREMTQIHGVNKSTIIKAYEELENMHIIYSVAKSGYYVTGDMAQEFVPNKIIDFSRLAPDEKLLPFREFNHCVNRAVDIYKRELFNYGNTQGLVSLRVALAEYFYKNDIYTKAKNIFITNGAHQALSLLMGMDFPNNKHKVLIEQPTYSEIYNMLETSGTEFEIIKRDNGGIDLNRLEKIFNKQEIKLFYTMPKFHNPLGTNLSVTQKKKILELADKYNVYIVEDDYLADIQSEKGNLPMHYYDTNNMVIYVRSFAKSFMPGIRLGCAVLPDELGDTFLQAKRSCDLSTSVLMQGALELYITNGMYETHIKKINSVYTKKYEVILEQLNSVDKHQTYIKPTQNSQVLWVNLKDQNPTVITNKLMDKGVNVSHGKWYVKDGNNINGVRLSIMPMSHDEIRQGIHVIYDSLKAF